MNIRAYDVITFTTTRISKTQYLMFCILMITSHYHCFQKPKVYYTLFVSNDFFSSDRTTFQILAKLSNGKNVAKHLICENKGLYSNSMTIEGVHLVVCTIRV